MADGKKNRPKFIAGERCNTKYGKGIVRLVYFSCFSNCYVYCIDSDDQHRLVFENPDEIVDEDEYIKQEKPPIPKYRPKFAVGEIVRFSYGICKIKRVNKHKTYHTDDSHRHMFKCYKCNYSVEILSLDKEVGYLKVGDSCYNLESQLEDLD